LARKKGDDSVRGDYAQLMRVLRFSTIGLLVSVSTCVCDAPSPIIVEHLDLDTILGAGEVRCGPVIRSSELIGGSLAYGQVNRGYRCHNSRIRFFVQDASRPVGNSVEGGNLIDVDRVRNDEFVDGHDTFREHVSGLGAQESEVTAIEVANDGTNGQPGIIRITGTPTALSLAPQANFLSQNLQGTFITEYRLAPDSDIIEIETTFKNDGDTLFGGLGVDFMAIGGATPIMTPQTGFEEVQPFSNVDFIVGARGDGVNVGFVCDGKGMTVPLVEGGVTVPICEDELTIGAEGSFKRFMVVGDGSIDSVARQAWGLLGAATGTVSGTVSGVVAGTVVSALNGPIDDADSHLVSEAAVSFGQGNDGAFELVLPPGDYTLVAHVPDLQGQQVGRSEPVDVAVVDGGRASSSLALGGSGTVVVSTAFDGGAGDAAPRAAKLTLVALDDTQRGLSSLLDFGGASSTVRYDVSADGAFDVRVPAGRYRAYVTRGFEWSRFEVDVDVSAGTATTVAASIARVLDTTGFVGGEFHQHSLGSIDAVVPVPIKVLENAAEGIEVAVSTEHDNLVDFRPFVEQLGLSGQMVAFVGEEVSYQAIGHFNAYPWTVDDADPFADSGSSMWWQKTVPEMFRDIRAGGGGGNSDILIQLNHPRSGLTGVLASMVFDPTDGARLPRDPPNLATLPPTVYADWSPAFDAIEVNTNFGDVGLYTPAGKATLKALAAENTTSVPVLADWFGMMNAGLPIAAMGNSDSHGMNGAVGYPRTFLFVGGDDPIAVDEALLRQTIRAQRTTIAEGCFITLLADDALHMGAGDLVAADRTMTVRLQAPPHVTVGRLELYVGGTVQPLTGDATSLSLDDAGLVSLPLDGVAAAGVERLRHAVDNLRIDSDSVVVAVSRGGTGNAPTGGGEVVCVSPPLYVDGDGDGVFTPPFAATEQVTRATP
jgi:hypothetical protein